MRIRKHAARILSSLSINPAQSRAGAAAEAPAAPAGPELEMHVCELNQSPWDAMAFTPPRGADLYLYQEMEDGVEGDGFPAGATLSGQGEEDELAAAVSDVSGCPTFVAAAQSTWRRSAKIEQMADGADEEEKRERRISETKKRNSSHNKKKIKRKIASSYEMEGAEDEKVKMELGSAGAAVTTCKKSDGKGWHCKRAAQHPHSLCEYHLTQVRSYYSNGGTPTHSLPQQQQQLQSSRKTHGGGIDGKQNAALIPDKKKSNIKKKTDAGSNVGDRSDVGGDCAAGRARRKPASDFYYYYSGFGPWRGKRRSGGDGNRGAQEAGNVDASDGNDARDGSRDGAASPMVHDQAPDDLDDDDEDVDGGDDVVGREGDDVAPGTGRRRGRKPIKARSLKSLL